MPESDFFENAARRMAASGLRQNNERAVLNALALHSGASGAHLARVTGLGAQTISRILVALEKENLITRGQPLRGQRGQPAIPISINASGAYSIGCEIGWRHLSVVLCNLGGQRLGEYRRDYPYPDPTSIVAEVASLVRLMINVVPEPERERVGSLGVAMPSSFARNLPLLGADAAVANDWANLDIEAELEASTGLPVHVMNDGNAACWAELVLRPRPRPNEFAYIFVGTFIGGGIVSEGRLWEGATGSSGNLGAILVSDGIGGLKVGHLVASLFALEHRVTSSGKLIPKRDPQSWVWHELGHAAERWLELTANALAQIIANTAAVSGTNLAVIDGALPDGILPKLVDMTQSALVALGDEAGDPPDLAQGHVGSFAAAVGAAFRPLYRQYFAREVEHLEGEAGSEISLSLEAPSGTEISASGATGRLA